jgi:hypothetical protein
MRYQIRPGAGWQVEKIRIVKKNEEEGLNRRKMGKQ